MKNFFKTFLLLTYLFLAANGYSKPFLEDKEKKILQLVLATFDELHYKSTPINDDFSKLIFNNYLNALDKRKHYFLESDYAEFKKIETKLDDQIKNNDLSFFYLTYERVQKRMVEAKVIYTELSKSIFKFNNKDFMNLDVNTYKFCKNDIELKNRWKNVYKLTLLNKIYVKQNSGSAKSFDDLEKEARLEIFEDVNSTSTNYKNFSRTDCFNIYINAIIKSFDENGQYSFSKEKLDVNLGGRLVGVGVNLEINSGFLVIKKIAFGSPAYKSKFIEVGDIVLKIGQENETSIDIVGLNLTEVIKLIKGKVGTYLKLTIKKSDGTIIELKLKREIIDVNDSDSKTAIVEKNGKKYGIINIPIFYNDLNKDSSRDAAKDVALELLSLKKEGVDGVIMDLRNNNSDSIETGFTICGYFLGNNPVTQIRNKDNTVATLNAVDAKIIWTGALVVLVNENTARTAEVFAAAIQDYKRGIIIGNFKSKGEGTLLKTLDLLPGQTNDSKENLGSVKIATQKFYRLNGFSFDQNGVNSDIVFNKIKLNGLKSRDKTLNLDKINPVAISQFNSIINIDIVLQNAKNRILNNKTFSLIEDLQSFKSKIDEIGIQSLHFPTFKSNKDKETEKLLKLQELTSFKSELDFFATTDDLLLYKKNEALKDRRNLWMDSLKKDIYVQEAINVLTDIESK